MYKKTHYFPKRSPIGLLDNNLWQIQSGIVRTTKILDNEELLTLGFWGAGDIVGKPLLADPNCELECLSETIAAPLPGMNYRDLLLIDHVRQLQELLEIRSGRLIEEMVFDLLTWLGRRFGTSEDGGLMLGFPLTHQDLAETLSTTRVTITRCLRNLEQRGCIRRLSKCHTWIGS
jgi:CRP-like cAMP-binding protein